MGCNQLPGTLHVIFGLRGLTSQILHQTRVKKAEKRHKLSSASSCNYSKLLDSYWRGTQLAMRHNITYFEHKQSLILCLGIPISIISFWFLFCRWQTVDILSESELVQPTKSLLEWVTHIWLTRHCSGTLSCQQSTEHHPHVTPESFYSQLPAPRSPRPAPCIYWKLNNPCYEGKPICIDGGIEWLLPSTSQWQCWLKFRENQPVIKCCPA